jgi:hypothetical protein
MKGFDELNVGAESVTHKANSHLEWIFSAERIAIQTIPEANEKDSCRS